MTVALLLWVVLAAGYWAAAVWACGDLRTEGANGGVARARSVCLVRPLHGAQPYLDGCLETLLCAAAEAGARVRLGVEEGDPGAAEAAAAAAARWPRVAVRIVRGQGPAGTNRKVSNLVKTVAGETAPLLVFSDADIAVPSGYVAAVTAPLAEPAAGAATCPYVSVRCNGLLGRLDALWTNARFLPSTCLAVRLEGVRFALGATIAVRRDALEAAGGLRSLLDEAADDYRLAQRLIRAGYRIAWVPVLVGHHLAPEPLGRRLRRHMRWTRVIREARPFGYLGLLVTHGFVPALLLASGGGAGRLFPVLWWIYQAGLLALRRRTLRLDALDLFLLPLAELSAFALYLAGWVGRAHPPD